MVNEYQQLQRYALCLVQSMLGVISSNFRFVSISRRKQQLVVTIVLEEDRQADIEEIEDSKTEFEALLGGPMEYKFDVIMSKEAIPWPDESAIVVFRMRESRIY